MSFYSGQAIHPRIAAHFLNGERHRAYFRPVERIAFSSQRIYRKGAIGNHLRLRLGFALLLFVLPHHLAQFLAGDLAARGEALLQACALGFFPAALQLGRQFLVQLFVNELKIVVQLGVEAYFVLAGSGQVLILKVETEDFALDIKLVAHRQPGFVLDGRIDLPDAEAKAELIGF